MAGAHPTVLGPERDHPMRVVSAYGRPGSLDAASAEGGAAGREVAVAVAEVNGVSEDSEPGGCCGGGRERTGGGPTLPPQPVVGRRRSTPVDLADMVLLEGGTFAMGADDTLAYPGDGEGPVHDVELAPFAIDRTRRQQRALRRVRRRDRLRDRRRAVRLVVRVRRAAARRLPRHRGVAGAPWWRQVDGADWRHPEGPHSDARRSARPPRRPRLVERRHGLLRVVRRHGCRPRPSGSTPRAAGSDGRRFPWGDELEPDGEHRMNVFQGTFPGENTRRRRVRRHRARSTPSPRTATGSTT